MGKGVQEGEGEGVGIRWGMSPFHQPANPGLLSSPLVSTQQTPWRLRFIASRLRGAVGAPQALGLGLCLAPPSLPLTWWFVLHLVCGAAGPALGV